MATDSTSEVVEMWGDGKTHVGTATTQVETAASAVRFKPALREVEAAKPG
jgi:hypothetical protein